MNSQSRIGAIDILKGVTIISILFLNVFYLNYQPLWLTGAGTPPLAGMIAGVLYPALIFLIGMTLPFSLSKRISEGLTGHDIIRLLFARSLILIATGVLMVNASRVEPELTGLNKYLWAILLVVGIFLTWNKYPEKENNFFTVNVLRLIGLSILVFLVFKFKSGTFENNGSIIPGWWELTGLAGWAYLIAGLTYLTCRNSLATTILIWAIFLALNVLTWLNMTTILDPVRPYLGVLLNGYIPVIILSGLLAGIVLKKYPAGEAPKSLIFILVPGLLLTASGIFLYLYRFNGSIYGNPAWALISSGATALIFTLIYWLDEVLNKLNPAIMIKPAGEYLFTIYILQFLLFNIAWLSGTDIFFFLKPGAVFLNIAGSVAWTLIVLATSSILIRFNVRLRF